MGLPRTDLADSKHIPLQISNFSITVIRRLMMVVHNSMEDHNLNSDHEDTKFSLKTMISLILVNTHQMMLAIQMAKDVFYHLKPNRSRRKRNARNVKWKLLKRHSRLLKPLENSKQISLRSRTRSIKHRFQILSLIKRKTVKRYKPSKIPNNRTKRKPSKRPQKTQKRLFKLRNPK